MEELLLESREFSKGIPLVAPQLFIDKGISYYTIKTTGNCDKHGEIALANTFNFKGIRYCGACYEEMLRQFCNEVK